VERRRERAKQREGGELPIAEYSSGMDTLSYYYPEHTVHGTGYEAGILRCGLWKCAASEDFGLCRPLDCTSPLQLTKSIGPRAVGLESLALKY
jgi:hypothetical protein